jgi:hypothetical protein
MHAANINYCNYLIPKLLTKKKLDLFFKANIIAHSDDSAGRFEANNKDSLVYGIRCYEAILALCNHNLSLKKCNLSKVYFEFLSILYIKSRLVPLVGKFISNLDYEPSDKGPCSDLSSSVSLSISLISMGGSFEEAFLKKWLYSKMVLDIYKMPTKKHLLPQLGGIPCSHVFFDLIAGTKSDLLRLYTNDPDDVALQLVMASYSQSEKDDYNIPELTMKPYIKMTPKLKEQKSKLNEFLSPLTDEIEKVRPGCLQDFFKFSCYVKRKTLH